MIVPDEGIDSGGDPLEGFWEPAQWEEFTFRDRFEAGRILAERLAQFRGRKDVIVLALPRGGVPVGFEVARALGVPLDVFLVRKLGVPGEEELAMGAIASGGIRILNREVLALFEIPSEVVEAVTQKELRELERREKIYRANRPFPEVRGKTVILVDDGIATGATMRAAIRALRKLGASRIVVAAPTVAGSTVEALREEADAVVTVIEPEPFFGVGRWYEDFRQLTDSEVQELLEASRRQGSFSEEA
ncbi:phosphoribosyltransferase [Candidatus Methylacidithermus pantelleriae]|uniref:Phosphoribosyl transferase n=1 Tax=Candidatus Methylacidithermus pantelleriae TaxID=2744239 RepID=A0A8J2BLR7_9BACT|nr:phosphoribosyltransferase [Candidatus Methylacidithermus pantelleriae]CAF0694032.1 Phosphoribosyl transferase [Candidatus Methylacidithermus pantelleriae]